MRKLTSVAAAVAVVALSLPAVAAPAGLVTNGADSGPGSLRAALESGANPVVIDPSIGEIVIESALVWDSPEDLVIQGGGATVVDPDGDVSGAILSATGGGDVSITNLTLAGPGGFSIENRGGASGLAVAVPASATGTVSVDLANVSVADAGLHGIHLDDLRNGGSDASVSLTAKNVTVDNSGVGGFDEDGIRVDEGGAGDIVFASTGSTYSANGADGVELDERGPGGVEFSVVNSDFTDNGNYCDFRLSDDPLSVVDDGDIEIEVPIGDFADADAFRTAIGANEAQNECIEIEDDDDVWVATLDLDDAFDVDEADDGSIVGKVTGGSLVGNFDEGLDYDEAGPGDIDADISSVFAADNEDEAFKYSEEDGGSVFVSVRAASAAGEDVEFEEQDDGDVIATIVASSFDDIELSQDDDGTGLVKIRATSYDDLDLEGATEG